MSRFPWTKDGPFTAEYRSNARENLPAAPKKK